MDGSQPMTANGPSCQSWCHGLMTAAYQLQQQHVLCDTVITSSDGGISMAHSVVLAAASQRMASILQDMKSSPKVIELDCSTEAVQGILHFLYNGNIPAADLEQASIADLLQLASRWDVGPLAKWCIETTGEASGHDPHLLEDNASVVAPVDTIARIESVKAEPDDDAEWEDQDDEDDETKSPVMCKTDEESSSRVAETRESDSQTVPVLTQNFRKRQRKTQSKSGKDSASRTVGHRCEVCSKMLKTKQSLKVHQRIHTGLTKWPKGGDADADDSKTKPSVCPDCGVCFKREIHLRRHRQTVHNIQVKFKCKHCARDFLRVSACIAHEKSHSKPKKTYQCWVCSQVFKQPRTLREHAAIHEGVTTFVCDVCGGYYRNSTKLREHKQIHEENRKREYQCTFCAKQFYSKTAVTVHEKYHRGKKEYACQYCSKRFIQRANCETHERIHTGERPFICETCGKAFNKPCHLKRHTATHSSEKPFRCETCGQRFNLNSSLKAHALTHSEHLPKACHTCGKRFLTTARLNKHNRSHLGLKPYSCRFCERAFTKNQARKAHELKVHGQKNVPNICTNETAVEFVSLLQSGKDKDELVEINNPSGS